MVKIIAGIAFLVVASITELALSQTCPQSTSTINASLQNFQKAQTSTVVYAWTGAHYSGGVWADRKNQTDVITSRTDGGLVSQQWSSAYSHGTNSDASSASASAQCNNLPNCTTASLSTSACVTSKVDSAGAGAYARAGVTVPPQSKAAKTGTLNINIPNRMTLTSNVGDESGVWGIAISVEEVKGKKSLVDKGHPDVAPFLVNLLGLKDEKQFKVHSDNQRTETFVAGFELDPQGNSVKLIGPGGPSMTAEQQSNAATILNSLIKRFVIRPCGFDQIGLQRGLKMQAETCHTAEYSLEKEETITIGVPYELPLEPETSKSDQILYIETGLGGRDVVQTDGVVEPGPVKQ